MMPTLNELKQKWFLDFSVGHLAFPPIVRYPGCTVSNHTDGNLVTPLIDGEAYMTRWYILVELLQAGSEVYHSAAWLESVLTARTLPDRLNYDQNSDSLQVMKRARDRGVDYRILLNFQSNATETNLPTLHWLRDNGFGSPLSPLPGDRISVDKRYPVTGSIHAKYIVIKNPADPTKGSALVASCDLVKGRWDSQDYLFPWPLRQTTYPSHEITVEVKGPAVADIERSFRDRWNDDSDPYSEVFARLTPISTPVVTPPQNVGTHSVQVLHTYGITYGFRGYSWSPHGEFTIWASYLNAIREAQTYIYIEEQYLLASGWPPAHNQTESSRYRDTDIIYQLGEALRRGVKVIILLPQKSEDGTSKFQVYQRRLAISYLANIAATESRELVVAYLRRVVGDRDAGVYVHGKLMIVDDEFVLLGSANICQRSMAHDGELQLGIVDAQNQFARDLREALWRHHLETSNLPPDFIAAYNLFKSRVNNSEGLMRPFPTDHPGEKPTGHITLITHLVDPYAGPERS
jgi:phosphatidylserine/phosphatidylglycerophosphate/cardiolipin synthase-like enzyme